MSNTQQLEAILKQEIEKLEFKLKQYNGKVLVKAIFDKLQGDFYSLISLSSSEIETLSTVLDLKVITDTIKKAIFLRTNSAGINNIEQYKQYNDVMSDLKSVYSFIKGYVEYDTSKLLEEATNEIAEYQKLLKETNGNKINTNNISISFVLSILNRLNLEITDENKILADLISDFLREKDEAIEEQILSDEEQNIIDLAEELLDEKADEIRSFLGEMKYAGYIGMLNQNLQDDIVNPEIGTKIELLKLSKYVNEANEWLNWYKSSSSLQEKDNILSEIRELITKLRPLVVKNQPTEKKEDKYKLVFFDSAKEDFHSDSLKNSNYQNQMVSILSELRRGDFVTEKKLSGVQRNIRRKKKYNLRVCYIPLANNLILLFAIKHREEIDRIYLSIINKMNNNLNLIDFIIEQSKTEEGIKQLLQGSEDINAELDALIEARNKAVEGGNYAR